MFVIDSAWLDFDGKFILGEGQYRKRQGPFATALRLLFRMPEVMLVLNMNAGISYSSSMVAVNTGALQKTRN